MFDHFAGLTLKELKRTTILWGKAMQNFVTDTDAQNDERKRRNGEKRTVLSNKDWKLGENCIGL